MYGPNVYSSAEISVTFNGAILLGFTPDSAVTISRNGDYTDEEVGADGRAVISVLPDNSCTIALSFQQESAGHKMFSDLARRQRQGRFLVQAPITVKTNQETIIVPEAHLKGSPEWGWGSSATGSSRVYTLWGFELPEAEASDFVHPPFNTISS